MTVSTDEWVSRLSSTGAEQAKAIEELRVTLLRGVIAASSNRYGGRIQPEDVVQDALVKILNKLHTFEGRSSFQTWAMKIAVRTAIHELRRKYYQDVSLSALVENSIGFEPQDKTNQDELHSERDQILTIVQQLIETELTPKQRDAIRASLNGTPVEVYAKRISSNRNAVYKLTHDARMKLRQKITEAGYDLDAILPS